MVNGGATAVPENLESVGVEVRPPARPPSLEPRSSPARCVCVVKSRGSRRVAARDSVNFERSAAPSRIFYFRDDTWVNFPDGVVEALRKGFVHRTPVLEVCIDGANYTFNFMMMIQMDHQTGKPRSISWIDENGKCFFPRAIISEEEEEEEECIQSDSSKRKLEEEPEVSSSDKRHRLEEDAAIAARWPNTRPVRETERIYSLVKDHFMKVIRRVDDGAKIIAIHQSTRDKPLFKARQMVFQKQLEFTKAARGTSNMIYAWYGASAKGVEAVLAHGFGAPSKVPPTEVYGDGVYLSPMGLPHLSANLADTDDNGVKHLILCRVVLGNVEKVEAGSQQYLPSNAEFDTGSDDPKNPKWYVVWSTHANMHILPECVLSFRPGRVQPVAGPKYSLEKLFLKIKSSLSPAKVHEILNSLRAFKAGKLTKDAFIRQLRTVAGDEVLRSAILEINASKDGSV